MFLYGAWLFSSDKFPAEEDDEDHYLSARISELEKMFNFKAADTLKLDTKFYFGDPRWRGAEWISRVKTDGDVEHHNYDFVSYSEYLKDLNRKNTIYKYVKFTKEDREKLYKGKTSFDIPEGVTRLENECFSECDSLKSITIPEKVYLMGDECFWYCKSLQSITIPKNVVHLGLGCFYGCKSLKEVTIENPDINLSCFFSYQDHFKGCDSLKTIYVPDGTDKVEFKKALLDTFRLKVKKKGEDAWKIKLVRYSYWKGKKSKYRIFTDRSVTHEPEQEIKEEEMPDYYPYFKVLNGIEIKYISEKPKE